jgi:hypothetical protein
LYFSNYPTQVGFDRVGAATYKIKRLKMAILRLAYPALKPLFIALVGLGFLLSHTAALHANEIADEDVAELSTISVTGSEQNAPKITTKKLLRVPGASGDPLKAIEALPGVVLSGFGPFSIPAIRGSNPRDNNYLTDFVPVGYVFHNDGGSTYNSNLIEDFSLKSGAWDAQYGNAIGAVLATKLRDPYLEPIHTTIDLSLLRAGALVEGAISEDGAFYISYRRSLLEFYVENFVDEDELVFTEVPRNSDYQLKYQWNINSSQNLRLIATGANDSVGIDFGPESEALQTEPAVDGGLDANTYYHNQAIVYDAVLSGGTSTILSFSRKEEDTSFSVGTLFKLDSVDYEYRLKNYYNTPLINGDSVRYGIDLSSTEIEYTASGLNTVCNDDIGETCRPQSLGEAFNQQDTLFINGAYSFIAYDWRATRNLEVTLGLANSYNDFNRQSVIQPRISSRYSVSDGLTLTAAIGRHNQFIREFRFIAENLGNPDLKEPDSLHYVAGFEQLFEDDLSAKVEVYYKDIDKLISSNPALAVDSEAVSYVNGASGKAYGLEILINKNLTDKWYGWLSATYSKTKRTNESTGVEIDYELDRPWVINLVTSYQKNEKTSYGFKWTYQSGALFTPVTDEPAVPVDDQGNTVDAVANPDDIYLYIPYYAESNSERLSAYHRLDFRMDHKLNGRSTFYFEIINLYNQQNVSGFTYNRDYSEREKVTSLPTIFSVGTTLVF